jgi:hypothetical protein
MRRALGAYGLYCIHVCCNERRLEMSICGIGEEIEGAQPQVQRDLVCSFIKCTPLLCQT